MWRSDGRGCKCRCRPQLMDDDCRRMRQSYNNRPAMVVVAMTNDVVEQCSARVG